MIEINNLQFSTILKGIEFQNPKGSSLAVIGSNGAGKTTLFHLILKLKFPSHGGIKIQTNKIGFVPERPYLSMEETFEVFLKLHMNLISFPKAKQPAEIMRVAEKVGLAENLNKKFNQFSKGMLQKAMLAQAMLGSPELIILDEPMSGLDPGSREDLKKQILELKKEGVTLVFSSHVMEDVEAIADRVLLIEKGEQKFFGQIEEWRANQ